MATPEAKGTMCPFLGKDCIGANCKLSKNVVREIPETKLIEIKVTDAVFRSKDLNQLNKCIPEEYRKEGWAVSKLTKIIKDHLGIIGAEPSKICEAMIQRTKKSEVQNMCFFEIALLGGNQK